MFDAKRILLITCYTDMINVLVIEDHGIVRTGIGHLVNAEQDLDIVAMAADGDEAMRLMENGIKADVVLADLHLGDTCGVTLAQTLLARYPELKILTMETDDRYLSQAFEAGVKGYLLKETDCDELAYGIRKVSQGKDFICTGMTAKLRQRMSKNIPHLTHINNPIDISRREAEILNLLADGFTNMQIADKLFTSKRTVEGHRQSLINKTGVKNTPELVKYALLNGLLQMAS